MGTRYRGSEGERRALDTFIKLSRSLQALTERTMQREPLPDKITTARFGILEALYHLGPLCQRELREKVLRSKGAVSVSVDQLEREGLVLQSSGIEDRRFRQVSLTEKGRTLIAGYFPRYARALEEEMQPLTPDEQRLLGSLARKLGLQEEQV